MTITPTEQEKKQSGLEFSRSTEGLLVIHLTGNWTINNNRPQINDVYKEIENGTQPKNIVFDTKRLGKWDSSLLAFLVNLKKI